MSRARLRKTEPGRCRGRLELWAQIQPRGSGAVGGAKSHHGFEGNQQQEKGAPTAAKDTKENIAPLKETTRVWKEKFSQNGIIRMDGLTE